MLSQKLTRITLKMSDLEEFEEVRAERNKVAMDTASSQEQAQEKGAVKTQKSTPVAQDSRRPVRASTPESSQP